MILKKQTRTLIKQKRKELSDYEISMASQKITGYLIACEQFKRAETIFLYAAFEKEVQTKYLHKLAVSEGKRVAYPKIQLETGNMTFYCVRNLDEMQVQAFKAMEIYEPNPQRHKQITPATNDMIIVPGLAFDKQGNRIGYGGGFYDRYLKKYSRIYKIGVCMHFQLFSQIAAEPFDVRVDGIVTELESYLPF